jgi:hypothetical protein
MWYSEPRDIELSKEAVHSGRICSSHSHKIVQLSLALGEHRSRLVTLLAVPSTFEQCQQDEQASSHRYARLLEACNGKTWGVEAFGQGKDNRNRM